jgi:hypothetical protein
VLAHANQLKLTAFWIHFKDVDDEQADATLVPRKRLQSEFSVQHLALDDCITHFEKGIKFTQLKSLTYESSS